MKRKKKSPEFSYQNVQNQRPFIIHVCILSSLTKLILSTLNKPLATALTITSVSRTFGLIMPLTVNHTIKSASNDLSVN